MWKFYVVLSFQVVVTSVFLASRIRFDLYADHRVRTTRVLTRSRDARQRKSSKMAPIEWQKQQHRNLLLLKP